jgi:DNA-binding NarL/FixJ family response regulator
MISPDLPKTLIVNLPERAGESLKTLLASHLGLAAKPVNGIQPALRALAGYSPELVFLGFDSRSPEPAELLRHLRQQFPRIRCVALLPDPGKKTAAMQAGAHFTLVRGFGVPELIDTVEQALKSGGCDRRTDQEGR